MRKRCGGRARGPDEKEIRGQNGERQIFANKEKTNIVRKRIFSRLREKRQISAKPRMTRPDRTGNQLAK